MFNNGKYMEIHGNTSLKFKGSIFHCSASLLECNYRKSFVGILHLT